MTFLFSNNAKAILAEALTATGTAISLSSGSGDKFPSPSSGEMFALFLTSSSNSDLVEVCYCTARSTDTLTVTRGMDGTTASAFDVGDYVTLGPVAGVTSLFAQSGDLGSFSTNVASKMGGYSFNAILKDSSSAGTFWVSTVSNNTTTPGASGASWQSLFSGYLSGTYGVVSTAGDKDGIGLHLDGATGNASFYYDGGSFDLASQSSLASEATTRANADSALSTAISTEVARAKDAEATLVSGSLGVIAANGDKQGTGLHYNGLTGYASFVYSAGSFDLASQSSLTSETSARESADSALSSAITTEKNRAEAAEADLVSGTLGVISSSGDKQGTGLHYRSATGNASFLYAGGSFDLAAQSSLSSEVSAREAADSSLSSSISAETDRAKSAEATAVSGTLGVVAANGDQQGTGLHYRGSTAKASFVYEEGSFDLASYSDIQNTPTLYTSSTTVTVPDNKTRAFIKLVGGGGSGCSCRGTSMTDSMFGSGGAAGGFVYFWLTVSSGQIITLTVGAGASAQTNTVNGQTNGGDTVVWLNGTEVARASGGTGGIWNSTSSSAGGTGGGATTQNGANPIEYSNGTDGGDGQTGSESIPSVTGYGGEGVWGGGGRAGNGGGNSGTGFGAGGGGAYDTSYSNTFYSGGTGHDGCAIVEFK